MMKKKLLLIIFCIGLLVFNLPFSNQTKNHPLNDNIIENDPSTSSFQELKFHEDIFNLSGTKVQGIHWYMYNYSFSSQGIVSEDGNNIYLYLIMNLTIHSIYDKFHDKNLTLEEINNLMKYSYQLQILYPDKLDHFIFQNLTLMTIENTITFTRNITIDQNCYGIWFTFNCYRGGTSVGKSWIQNKIIKTNDTLIYDKYGFNTVFVDDLQHLNGNINLIFDDFSCNTKLNGSIEFQTYNDSINENKSRLETHPNILINHTLESLSFLTQNLSFNCQLKSILTEILPIGWIGLSFYEVSLIDRDPISLTPDNITTLIEYQYSEIRNISIDKEKEYKKSMLLDYQLNLGNTTYNFEIMIKQFEYIPSTSTEFPYSYLWFLIIFPLAIIGVHIRKKYRVSKK